MLGYVRMCSHLPAVRHRWRWVCDEPGRAFPLAQDGSQGALREPAAAGTVPS